MLRVVALVFLATAPAPRDGGEPGDAERRGSSDGGVSSPDAGAPGFDLKLTPVAAPAYTPELGFLLTAGGVMSWNGDPAAPGIPRSSLTAVAGGSTVGAVLLQARLNSFWKRDDVRLAANLDVRDMPDHYFGVGFMNGLTRALGPDSTAYRRTWWQLSPTTLVRVKGPLYVGTLLDFTGTAARDVSAGVAADPDFARGGRVVVNTGFGITLNVDTRDVPVNAWRGLLLSVAFIGYGPWFGANTTWQALQLDYRHYVTLFREGSTLCWQVKHRSTWGEVPWSELSQLGTPWDLRAYRWGQYRDRSATSVVVEYRFMLPVAKERLWSRLGFAGWLGVGALGAGVLPDVERLLPSAGLGVRVEVQPRIMLRLDVGFGRESRAVYFNFLEAF